MPQLIIDLTPAQAQRVQTAMTSLLQLSQPATVEDVQNFLKNKLKQYVINEEKRIARENVQVPDLPI